MSSVIVLAHISSSIHPGNLASATCDVQGFFFFFSRINSEEEASKQDYGVSPITPRSAAQLRLRFLSRVGQQVSKLQAKMRI